MCWEKLSKKINKLKRKKLTYPSGVELLVESVQEEFAGIGREIQPGVLCEMLEIKDEEWRNAVEGYLNTQRFYVLVEPENFDIALGIYDRLRREKKVYGVGLINTKDLEKYDTDPWKSTDVRALRRPEKVFCFYHKGLYEISEPCGKCHQTRGISCAVYRQKCFYRTAGTG